MIVDSFSLMEPKRATVRPSVSVWFASQDLVQTSLDVQI